MIERGEIVCQGLYKTFKQGAETLRVLDGVDMTIHQGECVAILGSSGSGKTTLLQCLAGLDCPSKGSVIIDGEDINALPEKRRCQLRNNKMGFVFQLHHLMHDFTALENVVMPLIIRRQPGKEARKSAINLLERVGLGHRLQHRPAQLSGGERQRVAVARALITQPRYLLADEPTGNLDNEMASRIVDLLFELQGQMGFGMIMVTHDTEFSSRMPKTFRLKSGNLEN